MIDKKIKRGDKMVVKRRHLYKCWIAACMYKFSGQPVKDLVDRDVNRNLKWDKSVKDKTSVYRLKYLLLKHDEFRNIYYMRMSHHPRLISISRLFLKDVKTVEISKAAIGGGFMVSHYNAVIYPQKAGDNLRVGPGVVIGRNGVGFPKIGNNVYIAANSTVIGDIEIGDNVIIGAGSVVTKNVPSNSVFVGNPAHFIKEIGNDPELLNEIM